ncbi:MAG: aromatic amino acid lyase, partial [Bacteroidota bacterium]
MHLISNETLTFERIAEIIANNIPLQLSPASKEKIIHCRQYLDQKIKTQSSPIYGINTGFGSLYNVSIEEKDLSQLQKNLMMSHACGTGEEVPLEIVKLMLLLKIQSLSYGKSGVQLATVERLIDF